MLKTIFYEEYVGDPRYWRLEKCDFDRINLVVGRNSTGKSRLINMISGLCRILRGDQSNFDSGTYVAEIEIEAKIYCYEIAFHQGKVTNECLKIDNEIRLERGSDGRGRIFYQEQEGFIAFQVPQDAVAIQHREDKLQHPFVVELSVWAERCKAFGFGTRFGADEFLAWSSLQSQQENTNQPHSGALIRRYTKAFEQYLQPFDAAIIRDMKLLGYDLTDVGVADLRELIPGAATTIPEPVLGLYVTETNRPNARVPQNQLSQGMFRALAMVIHVNAELFEGKKSFLLIDDIGEGLDFERSAGLIDLLIQHASSAGIQVVMTSNDRFVMNKVPLEHWVLLQRECSVVKAFTERNSAKAFEEFRFIGLSNFDFFTSGVLQ